MHPFKFFLIVPVWLSLAIGAVGQDSAHWSVFIRGGYNGSNMAGSSSQNGAAVGSQGDNSGLGNSGFGGQKPRVGWQGGLGIAYRLSPKIRFSLGLNLEAKGGAVRLESYFPAGAYNTQEVAALGKSVFALNYLTLPLKIQWFPARKWPIYLQVGAYYGRLISAEQRGSFKGSGYQSKYSNPITSDYNLDDYGYTGAIGWQHHLGSSGEFFLELDWERSLPTIGPRNAPQGKPELFNQSLGLSAGYRIPL
ncbi:MAG TPA: outer membrane beta-barrel protein [Chitinophagaceae bacterium]|nr:outer membrane beta-barrel protein [Chitinophagaceae bacterium]